MLPPAGAVPFAPSSASPCAAVRRDDRLPSVKMNRSKMPLSSDCGTIFNVSSVNAITTSTSAPPAAASVSSSVRSSSLGSIAAPVMVPSNASSNSANRLFPYGSSRYATATLS